MACLEVAVVAIINDVDDDNDDYDDDDDRNETDDEGDDCGDSRVETQHQQGQYHLRNRLKKYLQNAYLGNVFLTSRTERRPAQPWARQLKLALSPTNSGVPAGSTLNVGLSTMPGNGNIYN